MTTYKEAGVDIEAGDALVERLKKRLPHIGGFGGLYPLGDSYLVAGTDGVGTKLKLAFEMNCHETVGIDLVAMCVNDIATTGAKPLFFLDYFATSKLDVNQAEKVIEGIMRGCDASDCLLLGGETAELPEFYQSREYDLAGFAVGIVKKDAIIDGKSIVDGDVLIGIPSSGIHSNGYSLVRKVLQDSHISLYDSFLNSGKNVGELLLTPTRIYVQDILKWTKRYPIKGICHVTGGGIAENLIRIIPKGLSIEINALNWFQPEIFTWLKELGNIPLDEMRRTFNLGIGLVLVMDSSSSAVFLQDVQESRLIGTVIPQKDVKWST